MYLAVDTRSRRGAMMDAIQNYMQGSSLAEVAEYFGQNIEDITIDALNDDALTTLLDEIDDRLAESRVDEACKAAA